MDSFKNDSLSKLNSSHTFAKDLDHNMNLKKNVEQQFQNGEYIFQSISMSDSNSLKLVSK